MKILRLLCFALLTLLPLPAFANLTFTAAATGSTAGRAFMPGLKVGETNTARLAEVRITGTFGGTTVTVQTSSDGGVTWVPSGVSVTAAAIEYIYVVPGDQVRVTCTGGAGMTITVRVR